jgi:hypothetical protein
VTLGKRAYKNHQVVPKIKNCQFKIKMEVPGSFRRAEPTHTVEHRSIKEQPIDSEKFPDEIVRGTHVTPVPPLAEWDPRSLPDNFFVVFEGKRRTGKSTFAKWMLQYYRSKFTLVWCMTNTKASGYWQKFVGEAFTFASWYPSAVWRLIERNDKIIKQYGEESEASKKLASTLIILDDVIADRLSTDPMFMRLAVEGRHHMISIMLMTQDPKAISPKVRDNTDVAIIFNQKTFRNKESIWHDFMNDTAKDFALSLLTHYAQGHNALVSVQTNLNGDVSKTFFKSTGDKTVLEFPDYILGGPDQTKMVEEERFRARLAKKEKVRSAEHAVREGAKDIGQLTAKEILK